MSGLQVGRCLKWTTVLVHGARSSNFRVGNCEWCLAIKITNYTPQVIICPNLNQATLFQPFKVICFQNKYTAQMQSSSYPSKLTESAAKVIESPTNHLLLECFGIDRMKIDMREEITFVFYFDGDTSLELATESDKKLDLLGLSSLSSDLGALLASGDSSDVKLMTNSSIRSAHRTVLACRSEVFSAMFRSDMKESTSGLVDVRDMDGTVFDLFLGYIYTGRFPANLAAGTLAQLYSAADKYAVHCLKRQCGYLLARCVTQENHQALLVLADAHRDQWLKDIVIEFIVKKPDWLKCEGWQQFSRQHQALANEVLLKLFNKSF